MMSRQRLVKAEYLVVVGVQGRRSAVVSFSSPKPKRSSQTEVGTISGTVVSGTPRTRILRMSKWHSMPPSYFGCIADSKTQKSIR